MRGLSLGRTTAIAVVVLAVAPAAAGAVESKTELVSESPSGKPGSGSSTTPAISANGDLVAFESIASNLVAGPYGGHEIYARSRPGRETVLVSSRVNGDPSSTSAAFPAVSADGGTVAFYSLDDAVTPGGSGLGIPQVYSRDLSAGATQMASVHSSGTPGDQYSDYLGAVGRRTIRCLQFECQKPDVHTSSCPAQRVRSRLRDGWHPAGESDAVGFSQRWLLPRPDDLSRRPLRRLYLQRG